MKAQTFSPHPAHRAFAIAAAMAIVVACNANLTTRAAEPSGASPAISATTGKEFQLRMPRIAPDDLLTPKGLAEKYLSPFDRKVLNRFKLPFFGVSNEARAMALHAEAVRVREVHALNETIVAAGFSDHPQAQVWKKELNRALASRPR